MNPPTLRERFDDLTDWLDEHLEKVVLGGVAVSIALLLLALFVWIIPAENAAQQAWEDHCVQNLHGRVISKDATTVGISTKDGSTIVTPDTDYFCISPSGGVLDIR